MIHIIRILGFVLFALSWPISGQTQTRDNDLIVSTPALGAGMLPLARVPNYRNLMREMVEELSAYARRRDTTFSVLVRPGFELLRWDQREFILAEAKLGPRADMPEDAVTPIGLPMRRFIQAIDGIVLSNQFCGEGIPVSNLQRFQSMGIDFMSIEHCGNSSSAMNALEQAKEALMISHADADRIDSFEKIPTGRPTSENANNINAISDARNMLVATATRPYGGRGDWLLAARSNNYDIIVVDAFFNGLEPLSEEEVHTLKFKELGARRLVLAWLDITHASDDRFYWERDWTIGTPSWIVGRHENRPGTFAVEYWHPRWKSIIGTYFAGLMDLGFDGVLLNGSNTYLRFEAMTPLEPL
ncbi:MAG: hypothetical protein ACJZ9F_05785 [Rhodospirillaceae bacterium]